MDQHDLEFVIGKLIEHVPSESLMIVGVRCRDLHQERLGLPLAGRTTHDIDFAIAISHREQFDKLRQILGVKQRSWQAVRIGGVEIDLIPLGELENPTDTIRPTPQDEMNVAGISEVFEAAEKYDIGEFLIKIPSIPG